MSGTPKHAIVTREELEAIKARVEAATPGPWVDMGDTFYESVCSVPGLHTGVTPICMDPEGDDRPQDRAFIAAAREDVPALVAEVERLWELLAKVAPPYDEFGSDTPAEPRT